MQVRKFSFPASLKTNTAYSQRLLQIFTRCKAKERMEFDLLFLYVFYENRVLLGNPPVGNPPVMETLTR